METNRLRTLTGNAPVLSFLLRNLLKFCSYSSAAAGSTRKWQYLSDDPPGGGSSVYRHALKFQRPSTIKWQKELYNSITLIGTVQRPVQEINWATGRVGAYTTIGVKASSNPISFIRILLEMWDDMAKISLDHLKPNDFIYVLGCLRSYTKVEDEKLQIFYKVIVKEINFVQRDQCPIYKKGLQLVSEGESSLQNYKNRLHLWQLFFANPPEWRDNRKRKVKPNHPDFKHKDTGEALWIKPTDPPWIKRQLQLHDSKSKAKEHLEDFRSSLSQWV